MATTEGHAAGAIVPKLCIVTGGSGGIGKEIARALAERGSEVIITGRSGDKLEEACRALASPAVTGSVRTVACGAGSVRAIPCDVSNEADVEALFASCPGVDLLVNCAGITSTTPTSTMKAEEFAQIMHVNVLGPFLCAREAFKLMSTAAGGSGGRIINVGSLSHEAPRPNSCPYTTSKFAVDGLTRSLSLDGRPLGIAVGVVHPGNVASPILSAEEVARREKSEGFIAASDVAACVLTMAMLPLSANVLELTVMPMRQPLVGRG